MKIKHRIGIDARLWNETGVGRYIRNLVSELAKIDTENEYILFFKKNEYENVSMPGKNFRKVLADIQWHSLKEQTKFPKILEHEQLDLMHFPYFTVPVWINIPFVVTIHDLILHHFPTGKASTLPLPVYITKQLAYRFIVAVAALKAKKIIAVSHTTAKQIEKDLHISSKKVEVTYEGIDSLIKLKHVPNAAKSNYFLYVGNAYPHKNVERLLSAFHTFTSTDENIKLVFVGKDDYFYRKLKEKVIQLHLEGNVKLFTNIKDEELANLYHNSLGLIIPSLMEGFGLPGLEAMNNGCLVMASEIPVFKEIYEDGAIFMNPLSKDSIVQTMRKVYFMSQQEKENYLKRGKDQVKKFSWKTMAAQTLAIYESCFSV